MRVPLLFEILEGRLLFSSAAYDLMGLTSLRNDPQFKNIDGRGVSVVVIDTGLDTTHPLIKPNYIIGTDVTIPGTNTTPTVTNPHGTHVAGIIGSKPDATRNYDGGVAPGVGLIAINVFTQGAGGEVSASNSNIEKALQWVEANQKKYNIVAVNMSLGGGFYTDPSQVSGDVYADEISTLQKDGVTVVSAAGNSYGLVQDPNTGQTQNVEFPNSGSPGILSTLDVGAVWDANLGGDYIWANGSVDNTTGPDRITSFSQRPPPAVGNGIFAPGAIITSTWPGDQLQQTQGTSQASPMVTGAVALLQNAAETFGGRLLAPTEVRSILQTSGDTINDGDNEDDGFFVDANGNGQVDAGEIQPLKNTGLNYPRLNVYKALKKLLAMFGIGGMTSPTGDTNGQLDNAILGPTLNGSAVDPIAGVLGTDGNKTIGNRDVDMYQFSLSAPGDVTIEIASDPDHTNDFDSYLRLFDSSGTQLAAADNGGKGSFSLLKKTLQPGTYYAGVSGAGNTKYDPITGKGVTAGHSGNFLIGFSLKSNDPNGLLSGAVAVNLASNGSQVFDGNIGTDYGATVGLADVDLFKITVPDTGTLAVDIDTPFNSNYINSFLRVFDSTGQQIGSSDDALATDINGNPSETTDGTIDYDATTGTAVGHATDSFVIGNVTRGDTYYFGVTDASNTFYDPTTLAGRSASGATGQYEISLTFANNDKNGSIPQAVQTTALPVSNILGSIGSDLGTPVGDRDVDMFKITPTTNGILDIKVDSYSLQNNTDTVDTVLKLFDNAGKLLATSDDVNGGPDPLLQISLTPNVDYYVAVAGKGNENFDPFVLGSGSPGDTGLYQLSISEIAASSSVSLSDDKIGDGAIQSVGLGTRTVAQIGMDNGFVRGGKDVDLYKFVPSNTGLIEIRAGNIDAFGADTYLRLFDSTGNELSANDNDGNGTVNSRIQAHVTKGVTYYIGVSGSKNSAYDPSTGSGATNGSTGQYVLTIDGAFARIVSGDLRVSGGSGNDTISLVRSSGSQTKVVRNGSTLIFVTSGYNHIVIDAGAGNDTVTIGASLPAAYVDAGAGNDSVTGGDGNDTLTGGAGKNTLNGGNGNDRLNGSGSRDLIFGGAGNDRLYGNGGDDTLDGGGGVDRLFGGDGNDSLLGGSSNDKLYGQAGNDTLKGQGQADLCDGGPGTDTAAKDVLDSDVSIETLV